MDMSTGENTDSVTSYSQFLLHRSHRHSLPPPPPAISATVDCQHQFLQLFQHVDHVADSGRTSNEVDRLSRHQAPALMCDEENSTSSSDSLTASRSHVHDIASLARDTAAGDKLSRLQRPEHRQVWAVHAAAFTSRLKLGQQQTQNMRL